MTKKKIEEKTKLTEEETKEENGKLIYEEIENY